MATPSPSEAGRAVPSTTESPGAVDTPGVLAVLVERGMLLESARGPLPNVAELVAGGPIRGSWWGHPASHRIYRTLTELAASPDVVRLRLIDRKVTLVHRRVWPALARVSASFPPAALTALTQEHTTSGAHRRLEQAYPSWLPDGVESAAGRYAEDEAWAELPPCLRQP
jgi:hypothetical protein